MAARSPLTISRTIADVRQQIENVRQGRLAKKMPGLVAFVPTMGALHEGHLSLVRRAHELADIVVVSIFVNPLQFGPNEDLDRYPRAFDADRALLEDAGVDLIFAPDVDEIYPTSITETRVTAGQVGTLLEGQSRPGHFDGVLTIVNKLFNIIAPDIAIFGQKDAQQVFVVKRMVRELDMPVVVEVVETDREEDGLARSSRNRYLTVEQRRAARRVPEALEAAVSSADRGPDAMVAAAQSVVSGESGVTLEYLAIVNPDTFQLVPDDFSGAAIVLIAARVGTTRLIDNDICYLP